jgi:hypothetical protein
MKPQLLVVVSDLHCGSTVGLLAPDVETHYGNTVGFGSNYHQEWLWDKWQEGMRRVFDLAGDDPYVLLCNGDATEGIHHRSPEVVATLIEDHCRMAAAALKGYAEKAVKVLITRGTECHTHNVEDYLANLLGAGEARDHWLFTINGTLCNATHHMPATSRAYLEASAMSINLGNARLNCIRSGHPVPSVYLRAHRHCGGWYTDGAGILAVTGGWQFLTRHGKKVVPDAIPRPSVIVLDWRGLEEGTLPHVHNFTFNPPPPVVTHL